MNPLERRARILDIVHAWGITDPRSMIEAVVT